MAGGFWVPAAGGGTLSISDDGRQIAVSRNHRQVDILDLDTLAVLRSLPNTSHPAAFTEMDTALLSTSFEGALQRWSLRDPPSLERETPLFDNKTASQIIVSADDTKIAATNSAGELAIWDVPTWRRIRTFVAHKERIWLTTFSPDGDIVATAGGDNYTRVWQTSDGSLKAEWPWRLFPVSAAFDSQNRFLAFGLSNGDIELRDARTFTLLRTLRSGSSRISALAFSLDGSRLVAGGPNGTLHFYATDGWREVATMSAVNAQGSGNATVATLTFTRAGNALIAYLADGRVRVWSIDRIYDTTR